MDRRDHTGKGERHLGRRQEFGKELIAENGKAKEQEREHGRASQKDLDRFVATDAPAKTANHRAQRESHETRQHGPDIDPVPIDRRQQGARLLSIASQREHDQGANGGRHQVVRQRPT
jgi:hypothetical protein